MSRQQQPAAQRHHRQQQHRGPTAGAIRSKPEVVRIRLLDGFCLWVDPLLGGKVATKHTQLTEVRHIEGRVSHRWPAIGAERR
jgi:hypothetical protein